MKPRSSAIPKKLLTLIAVGAVVAASLDAAHAQELAEEGERIVLRVEPGETDAGALRRAIEDAHLSRSGEALPGPRLYEAMGRFDLADRYRQRQRARSALLGVGIALDVAAVLVEVPIVAVGAVQAEYSDRGLLVGSAVALGITAGLGLTFTIAGALHRARPIGPRATRRLVDKFNASVVTPPSRSFVGFEI